MGWNPLSPTVEPGVAGVVWSDSVVVEALDSPGWEVSDGVDLSELVLVGGESSRPSMPNLAVPPELSPCLDVSLTAVVSTLPPPELSAGGE